MPFKDPAVHREYMRNYMRGLRGSHLKALKLEKQNASLRAMLDTRSRRSAARFKAKYGKLPTQDSKE